MSISVDISGAPGAVRRRADVLAPRAYAVFDCETTGTRPGLDEIVSLAVVRLDADGVEVDRFGRLVRPWCPIPVQASQVHGIRDEDVVSAPRIGEIAQELSEVLSGAVFVAHNAPFDLGMLRHAFARAGIDYSPISVACTLDAFRLLEPLADDHRLESICERRGIILEGAHEARNDVLATVALLRLLLAEGLAPETVELDLEAFLRLRARGDTRQATERQIRRVFGLARSAGLLLPNGEVDRAEVDAVVQRVAGSAEINLLTRAQVQRVYDVLEHLSEAKPLNRAA
jgi:DNA polymerase III subunit epsilon